jgi:2-polyprenyl-6-methoxyphenol hydroxylase-like FAD-dependent oxidoreductase
MTASRFTTPGCSTDDTQAKPSTTRSCSLPFEPKGGIDLKNVPTVMQMRKLWHGMLWWQIERFGTEVSFGKRIVQYCGDAERGVAGIITDKGVRVEANVILAADGLNSSSQAIVMPNGNKGMHSGRSVFRCAYPLGIAMADHLVKKGFEPREGKFLVVQTWLGPASHLVALRYFDSDGNDRQMM